MYSALLAALQATGIPFAEAAWKTRPAGDYGVIMLDGDGDVLRADDTITNRATDGSIDLFAHGKALDKVHAIQTALFSACGSAWELNSIQYEANTGYTHYEWYFSLEEAIDGELGP